MCDLWYSMMGSAGSNVWLRYMVVGSARINAWIVVFDDGQCWNQRVACGIWRWAMLNRQVAFLYMVVGNAGINTWLCGIWWWTVLKLSCGLCGSMSRSHVTICLPIYIYRTMGSNVVLNACGR